MTNQEILNNAPSKAISVDDEGDYIDENGIYMGEDCHASEAYAVEGIRSLADIRRIVELEGLMHFIIDAEPESDDPCVISAMYYSWLHAAKKLKGKKL